MNDRNIDRWWPESESRFVFRSEEIVYAALGPHLTHRLIMEFERCLEEDPALDSDVGGFFQRLRDSDGRPPGMLFLMAVAAVSAMSAISLDSETKSELQYRELLSTSLVDQCYKFFGSFVLEAVQGFGFSEETFLEYVSNEQFHFGFLPWPPPGVSYTRQAPKPSRSLVLDRMLESNQDPLAFWQSLREYPSLIGAHLVELRELRRYEKSLVEGLENVRRDIEEVNIGDPELAEIELRRAVEKVGEALRLIEEAQEMIVRRFST